MSIIIPKKLRHTRNKKFTEKRRPYKPYLKAKWSWDEIFDEINQIKDTSTNFLKYISDKYGIVYGTLKNKYNKYCKNNKIDINIEKRGGSNRIFTRNEERELYDHIKSNFIDKNTPLTNNIIKKIALERFKHTKSNKNKNFNNSDGWCNTFKKKWNLSTQKVRCSKKATNIPTDDDIKIFLDKCDDVFKNFKKSSYLIMMKQNVILQILHIQPLE